MREIIICLLIIILTGCSTNTNYTSKNETSMESKKMCAEYKVKYPTYLEKRYNLIEDPGYSSDADIYEKEDGINYNVLKDYSMFYSSKLDSCVASFRLRHFYPTNAGHMDEWIYYIVDTLNETELWTGGGWIYDDDEMDKIREEWYNKINEYKE